MKFKNLLIFVSVFLFFLQNIYGQKYCINNEQFNDRTIRVKRNELTGSPHRVYDLQKSIKIKSNILNDDDKIKNVIKNILKN